MKKLGYFILLCLSYGLFVALLVLSYGHAHAQVAVYTQTPRTTGELILSSKTADQNGSEYDTFVWDNFTLGSTQEISAISWRGGFDPAKLLTHQDPILGFTINVYSSTAGNTEPNLPTPMFTYNVGGNANQTAAGTFNSVTMYNYSYTLPTTFTATGGTEYWLQIQATQLGTPDWGFARAVSVDNGHWKATDFGGTIGSGIGQGDMSFTLSAPSLAAVPEPESVALIGALGALGFTFWQRSRRVSAVRTHE